MKLIKGFPLLVVAVASMIMFTAAFPSTKVVEPKPTVTTVAPSTYSYKELVQIATEAKGSKLTLKEKVALKIFGKKIQSKIPAGSGGKSQLTALLICGFIGVMGIHRFYLGYTWQGIVQLLTAGVCGIWTTIDFVRIITGSLQPKDSEYEKTL
jgi:hypothetical protein